MPKPNILIVEDYEGIVTLLRSALEGEFELVAARSTAEGLAAAREHHPLIVLLDLGSPPKSSPEEGLRFLQQLKLTGTSHKTVVCTGYGDRSLAVRAVAYGACDVLYKPLDVALVKGLLRRLSWVSELEAEARELFGEPAAATDALEQMIGTDPSMQRIFDAVGSTAPTDTPVLITGEIGTGKELTARAIHQRSLRRTGPFITVSCGLLPDSLVEADLFGAESDRIASDVRRGKLESARGGTLFLEEVDQLSSALQGRLLRFMDEGEADRARILAGCSTGLEEAVEAGRFREDLSRRLGMVQIHIPPLRERGEDAMLLAIVFLRQASAEYHKRIHGFTKEAVDAIRAYRWPGNVRELASRVRRAVLIADQVQIGPDDLAIAQEEPSVQETSISLKVNQQRIETDLIMKAFTLSNGNLSRAAHELGISRSTLYRRIRQYGLDRVPETMRVS